MTIAVDLGRKATTTKKKTFGLSVPQVVNTSSLPVYKKYRVASLLSIFET